MAYLESCSTDKILLGDEKYISKKIKIDPSYITIQISIISDKNGTLKVYHSHNGILYDTYGDELDFIGENSTHQQFSIKGQYLYIEYLNSSENQTLFNLISKFKLFSLLKFFFGLVILTFCGIIVFSE